MAAGLKFFLLYLWTTPYLLKFALVVGMGGLISGYDWGELLIYICTLVLT